MSTNAVFERNLLNVDGVDIAKTLCSICDGPAQQNKQGFLILFLCRHVVHASCISTSMGGIEGGAEFMKSLEPFLYDGLNGRKGISGNVAL